MNNLNPDAMDPVPAEQWDASLRHVIDDMHGRPLNIHALIANHPPLLKAWWDFRNYIVSGGALGTRNAELVILRTAWHAGCSYEWASHVVRGMAAGLSLTEIERVKAGPVDPDWSDTDALILRAVDNLNDTGALQPRTFSPLVAALGNDAVLDLIAIRGTYAMLGDMLSTYGVALDESVAAELPDAVTAGDFST
ncbi:MAG: carboxymuconolactone decarboxylase family protein [Woeseiaceae bacterium]